MLALHKTIYSLQFIYWKTSMLTICQTIALPFCVLMQHLLIVRQWKDFMARSIPVLTLNLMQSLSSSKFSLCTRLQLFITVAR